MIYIRRGFKTEVIRNLVIAKGMLGKSLKVLESNASEDVVNVIREALRQVENAIRICKEAEVVG